MGHMYNGYFSDSPKFLRYINLLHVQTHRLSKCFIFLKNLFPKPLTCFGLVQSGHALSQLQTVTLLWDLFSPPFGEFLLPFLVTLLWWKTSFRSFLQNIHGRYFWDLICKCLNLHPISPYPATHTHTHTHTRTHTHTHTHTHLTGSVAGSRIISRDIIFP